MTRPLVLEFESLEERFAKAFANEAVVASIKDAVQSLFPKRHSFHLQPGDWIHFVTNESVMSGTVLSVDAEVRVAMTEHRWTRPIKSLFTARLDPQVVTCKAEEMSIEEVIFAVP